MNKSVNIRLLSVAISLLISLAVSGQHLRRKGVLGVEYTEASDSLMRSLRVLDARGMVVKRVSANSTAAQLGLRPDDVLVAINETDTLYEYDFAKATAQLYENDPIAVTFVRNRRKSRVVGTVKPAPRETSAVGEVLYDEVDYQRGHLRSIVHRPRIGSAKLGAIFYLQDYPCQSIDFTLDSLHPTKQLIEGWVKAGYVVYRLEKPGIGESSGTKDCSRLTYAEELNAFDKGLAALKKYSFVDSSRIVLFGHGTGGTLAPLLARTSRVKGIMTYGTTLKSWFEHNLDALRQQPTAGKMSYLSADANVRMLAPLLYEWLVMGKSGTELMQNPEFEAILTAKENPVQYNRGTFYGRAASFFAELNQQNLAQAWGLAATPTLAMQGDLDGQVATAQDIAGVVNEVKAGRGTFKILKNTDHFFMKKNNTKVSGIFNNELLETTTNWLNQLK